MEFLLTRFRNLAVLLVVLFAQLLILAYQVKKGQDVSLIRVWSVTAITPIAKVLEVVRANTIGIVENYFVLVNVREQNIQMQKDIGKLKLENQFLRAELQTADRARALQAFQSQTPSKTLPSRIIGTGTGTNSRVVFVDQGSSAGVMKGMAVVTPDGIVGKVLAAYPTASQVLLITDQTFRAGVVSEKHRVHGTVGGLGQSKVEVKYVQNEEKVENGEMFYTSGDDRVFPRGMPVGRVSVAREGKTFKEIYLVPSGLQGGVEEVLIVLDGVHGAIPETQLSEAQPVKILPAPPVSTVAAEAAKAAAGTSPTLMTDADRLRERYKRIGEAQNHPYGDPSKPPNFNLNPDTQPPAAAQAKPPQPGAVPTPPATGAVPSRSTAPAAGGPKPAAVPPPRPVTTPGAAGTVRPAAGQTQRPAVTPPRSKPAPEPRTQGPVSAAPAKTKPAQSRPALSGTGTGIFARPPRPMPDDQPDANAGRVPASTPSPRLSPPSSKPKAPVPAPGTQQEATAPAKPKVLATPTTTDNPPAQ
ncbi:MAG TPA: rod shape-determining protein MreC [Bryobacteraceae bacterium]|nr:rod shape-determining protein MreC [Bryobacteraceae bacterium]